MQDNSYSLDSSNQKSPSPQHSASANDNSTPSTIITSTSTLTRVPAGPHQLSSAVVPVSGNDDNSLTAFSDAAESARCAAHAPLHQTVWDSMLHVIPTRPSHYSINTQPTPWLSTAETDNTRAYAPPTWSNVTSTHPIRSQVPSGTTDPDILERTSHRGNGYHAVGAPAQPPSLSETGYPSYPTPRLYMPFQEVGVDYRSTSQVATTGFGGVGSWTAQSMPIQAPSLSYRRRYARKSHARPDRVICDKCQKSMRPQSLKRHVKEVHDHIKRHTKRGFAAES